ncbi:MAG: hypothetical protein OEM67_09260 [Thermoleophilia bacterium]|nr:hypothetical protein [Thermoleophilia bacterium]
MSKIAKNIVIAPGAGVLNAAQGVDFFGSCAALANLTPTARESV